MSWIWEFLQLLLGAFELFICFRVLSLIMQVKIKENHKKVITVIVIFLTSILIDVNRHISFYSYSLIVLLVILISLLSGILYREKFRHIFLIITLYYLSLTLLDLFCVYSIGIILNRPDFGKEISISIDFYRVITLLSSRIVILLICEIANAKKLLNKILDYSNKLALSIIIILEAVGIIVFQRIYGYKWTTRIALNWYLFFIVAIFLIAFFVLYLLYRNQKEEITKSKLETELLAFNYKNIYEGYINSERIFHDMKNHIMIISQYIIEDENDKALEYIEKIKGPIFHLDNSQWSGIKVIDFILNYKLMEAEKSNIEVQYYVDSFKNNQLQIHDSELCALLSNLIDNAIEACAFVSEKERWMQVSIRYINNMLMVKTSNSIACIPNEKNGKFYTTKKDKMRHGIGLGSVQNIVDQYGGCMEYLYNEKQFDVSLTLFC